MRISQTSEMAIQGLWELAEAGDNGRLLVADIARRQNVSKSYLSKVFNRLRHAGLVDSRRGKVGGFHLARPASAISLGEVVRLFDGTSPNSDDWAEKPAMVANSRRIVLQDLFRRAERRFYHMLDATTLADLSRAAPTSERMETMGQTPESTETL